MLYEMVSGKSPFAGSTPMDTLSAIIQKTEVPVRELNPEVPPKLAEVVTRCLEKDPGERYQDSRDLVVDLKRLTRDVASGASSPAIAAVTVKPMWQRPTVLIIAALSGLLLVVAAGYLFKAARAPTVEVQANSLAVLAFQNLKDPADPERLGQILQELIITDLSGAGSLKVFSSQRLFDVFKQIAGKDQKTVNRELATQVAAHAGASTMLTGTLSQLGTRWIMTGQLVDVAKGTVLKSARIDGTDLYAMVDQLTGQIRADVSAPVVDTAIPELPVGTKTTTSMEAYRLYLTGVDLLNSAKYGLAAEQFEKAIAIDPAFSQAYYKMAIARWWNADDLELAQRPLTELVSGKLRTSAKEKLMAEATLGMVSRCYRQTKPKFERLVREYPDEKEAWYGLGESLYHGGGDLGKARDAFESAIKLDPSFTLAFQHVLDVDVQTQNSQEFFRRIKSAISKNPQDLVLYRYWLQAAIRSSDEKETAEAMAEALKHHASQDERRELFKSTGKAYVGTERTDIAKAGEFFKKALDNDPKRLDSDVLLGVGAVQYERGDHEGGLRRFLEVLDGDPGNHLALVVLYDRYGREQRYAEFIAKVKTAIRTNPENPALYRLWVKAAVAQGNEAETAQAMEEAVKRHAGRDALRLLDTQVAWSYIEASNPEKAEELAQAALAAAPDCETAEIMQLLGLSCSRLGRHTEAERWFLKGLELESNHGGLQNGLFWTLANQRRYNDFLVTADGWTMAQPGARYPYLLAANAAVCLGDEKQIETRLAAALAHYTDAGSKKWLFTELAWRSWDLAQYKKVEEFARKAIEAAPDQPDASVYALRGLAALKLKNYREAEEWFRKALAITPTEEGAMSGLAELYLELKENEKAVDQATRLVKSSPTNVWHHAVRVEVDIGVGQISQAERALASSLSAFPSTTSKRSLLTQAGRAYFRAGRYDSARQAFDRAVLLDPESRDADLYEGMGWLAARQGNNDEARRSFAKGLAALPRHDGNLRGLATIELLARDYPAAEKRMRDQLDQGPARLASYRLLGSILAEEGKFAEAEKLAQKAVALDASRASYNLLAWILVAGGLDIDRGVEAARQALKIPSDPDEPSATHPFTPVAEHTLGLAAIKKGSKAEAVKLLEVAARLRPDRASIREDLERARRSLK
jgi:tetratricopeptide (TPR) repeat protein